jgi:natural product biosynthesis luciferase-like monooxygenase protein
MDIGTHIGYDTALVAGDVVLSVAELKERAARIAGCLLDNGVRPFDKVQVIVREEQYLLPILWALLKNKVTCILANPMEEDFTMPKDALVHQAEFIIKTASSGVSPDSSIISEDRLMDFFGKLDLALEPNHNDVFLLSRCVPYATRVMEMVWASSRGITVVIAEQIEMDFGLFHFGCYIESSSRDKYKQLFDTVQYADQHNFKSVWTPERHFNNFGGLFPNPSVLSAALAVMTSRVQIRCGSLVSPLHHTIRIAEDWALIDNLSNGRVAISFASGWQCDDFVFFPGNYARRHEHMMEQIAQVKKMWRGESIAVKNGLDKEIEVSIYPKPVQSGLPIWITVSGRTETFVDAGKIGANILTHLLWQDTDELIEKIAAYRQSLAENGFDPRAGKVSVMVHTYLGIDNETVKNKVREPLKKYIKDSTQLIQSMVRSNISIAGARETAGRFGGLEGEIPPHLMDELLEIAFNRFFDKAGLLGTIEKAREMIKKLKEYDVNEIAALIDFGLSREEIMEGLTILNRLKNEYDNERYSQYPVTIVHADGIAQPVSLKSPKGDLTSSFASYVSDEF